MPTHRLETDVHQTVADLAAAGRRFALAVVLHDAGSTPRKAGTKAIVEADGSIRGTIGGGLLEDQARRLAVEGIRSGRPAVFEFKFGGTSAAEDRPVCGGAVRVLVDPTAADHRPAYARAAEARRRREGGTLLTSVTTATTTTTADSTAPRVSVRWLPGDDVPADLAFPGPEAVRAATAGGAARHFAGELPAERAWVEALVEPLAPGPLLIVVGGGHVGQALARQAVLVGFEVVVVEDRPEFADPALFPEGVAVRCGDVAGVLGELPVTPDTYVALVSRGHLVDAKALAACIHRPAGYVGMMGSRRKVALVRRQFIESGLATAEQFDRVHAPIGLDIGAETVPEIAASIVAQLIAVRRRNRPPRPRQGGHDGIHSGAG